MILRFSRSKFQHKADLIFDCLCWDWCGVAGSHYYPPFLKHQNSLERKKVGNEYFHQLKKDGFIEINEFRFSLNSIKKTIFYFPSTLEFYEMNNLEQSIYAFIPDDKKKVIIPISL